MKRLTIHIITFIIIPIFWYLIFSFVLTEINFVKWTEQTRITLVFFIFPSIVFSQVGLILFKKDLGL